MSEYIGEDEYEYVGEDDEILGAVRRSRPGRAMQMFRAPQRASRPVLRAEEEAPAKLRTWIGLGRVVFTAGSGTTLSITVEPQRSFRIERLVIARRDAGTVGGLSTTLDTLMVGELNQSPSVERGAPTEMFSPDAASAAIDCDVAKPGQKITATFTISSAPAGSDTVTLVVGAYGSMIR